MQCHSPWHEAIWWCNPLVFLSLPAVNKLLSSFVFIYLLVLLSKGLVNAYHHAKTSYWNMHDIYIYMPVLLYARNMPLCYLEDCNWHPLILLMAKVRKKIYTYICLKVNYWMHFYQLETRGSYSINLIRESSDKLYDAQRPKYKTFG